MIKTRLFRHFFILLVVVAVLNLLAEKFYLYWSLWWFDMLVHSLAGVCIGMASFLVFSKSARVAGKKTNFVWIALACALSVGILWEIYELYFGITFLSDGLRYWTDTSSDILMDIFGALIGTAYALKLSEQTNDK